MCAANLSISHARFVDEKPSASIIKALLVFPTPKQSFHKSAKMNLNNRFFIVFIHTYVYERKIGLWNKSKLSRLSI